MDEKIRVRLKSGSALLKRPGVSREMIGTVMCRYRILREGKSAPERMDVRFDERNIIWGAPEPEFEALPDHLEH
jgi:hypothetical protein